MPPLTSILLAVHAAATLIMVGLIWFVQVVHYPLFGAVGTDGFASYARRHAQLTSWVVGPPMLIEAASALALLFFAPPGVPAFILWLGLALLALIWLSTALFQVPAHTRLQQGFDPVLHQGLVRSNWIRTLAWSGRGLLVLWML